MFEPLPERLTPAPGLRAAAVLVPVLDAVPLRLARLLFTLRSERLAHHRGQISFPGGAIEPGEAPLAAALREAWEEIGLPPEAVQPLGALRPVRSPAGFWVLPVVGRVTAPFVPRPNPDEVAEVFVAPVPELLAAPAYPEERRGRTVWHVPWRDRDIWGVTGNILKDFLDRLKLEP